MKNKIKKKKICFFIVVLNEPNDETVDKIVLWSSDNMSDEDFDEDHDNVDDYDDNDEKEDDVMQDFDQQQVIRKSKLKEKKHTSKQHMIKSNTSKSNRLHSSTNRYNNRDVSIVLNDDQPNTTAKRTRRRAPVSYSSSTTAAATTTVRRSGRAVRKPLKHFNTHTQPPSSAPTNTQTTSFDDVIIDESALRRSGNARRFSASPSPVIVTRSFEKSTPNDDFSASSSGELRSSPALQLDQPVIFMIIIIVFCENFKF